MTDSLSFDQLAKLFHMPLSDAAKEIGICCTALKKACRKNNITRWPHRKVKSLDRMIEGLEAKANEAPNSEEADKVMIELEYYKNQRGLIMKNTGSHRLTDQALKMKPCSAISKSSSSSLGSGSSSSSSSSFYGTGAAASSPLSSSVSSPSNVLGFGLSHHGLAASSSSSSSGSPSSGTDSSSSPEMYQPSPADSELFDNLIFASEFNQQQQQQNQLQFQQQQMAQHYQDLFQQQLAIMQMPEFCTPAASSASASQQQTSPTTAGPFFPKPAVPSFSAQQQQQQQQQVVSPQNLFYFQQPMMDGKNGAFMNPQFMYNFSPNAMPFMPNPMSAFMFPFGYPFPSFPMASAQSPVDLSVQTNQNQLRSFPSSSSSSAALPALSTPEPSYSAESPSFFRNSDALDALFVKQEGNFDSSLPEYAQAF